jgi:hypothetical protein
MKTPFLFLIIATLLLGPPPAEAFLFPNVTGERTSTLPKGRWMVSYLQYSSTIQNQFQADGKSRSISEEFHQEIPWSEVVSAEPARSAQVAGLLEAHGVDLGGVAGVTQGEFAGMLHAHIPLVGYGLTDHLGVFFVMPMIRLRAESSIGFLASDSAKDLVQSLNDSGQSTAARQFADSLNYGFVDELARSNYQFSESIDQTFFGDLQVLFPWVLPSVSPKYQFVIQSRISVPSGATAAPDDLFTLASGKGRWGVGSKLISGYQPHRSLQLLTSAEWTVFSLGEVTRRVPLHEDDRLPMDEDKKIRLTGGSQYSLEAGARLQIARSWSVTGFFQQQEQLQETFKGESFEADRYALLSKNSGSLLRTFNATLDFNSIAAFLDGDLPVPVQAVAGVGLPLAGRQGLADPVWLFQTTFFF